MNTDVFPLPMAPSPLASHIAIVPGFCGGKPHILGHRIKVQHVVIWHERMGLSPDEIVSRHPSLTLAQVYSALSYYWDHQDEIESDIREGQAFVEKLRGEDPSIFEKVRIKNGSNDSVPS